MVVAPLLADDPEKGTSPSPAAAAPTTPASAIATPPAVQAPIAAPAKPASTSNYCYAYLTVGEERGATCSPVVEINDIDGSRSVFEARLNSYIEKVKQLQPGSWGEFEYSKTTQMYSGFIYEMKPKAGFEASKQSSGLICLASQAKAEANLKQLKKDDSSLKIVGWP
jgi:hypothetical protein